MSILFFVDINECVTEEHNCDAIHAYCNNTKGSFACLCDCSLVCNYRNQISFIFLDVDECTKGSHDCLQNLASCSNTDGSYHCSCRDGYIGDGKTSCKPKGGITGA